jgi:apolipoprotein D and lipocalin family protein
MWTKVAQYVVACCVFVLSGCVSVPEGITPIKNFELDRYLGTWYEIARLDHSFERGMEQVTATYSLREDGSVNVANRGYVTEDSEWNDANGVAKFANLEGEGHLKVSFFGPFYASYVIFELDSEDYSYAFVTGPNRDFLWFLSRTPQVNEALKQQFLNSIQQLNFNTEELIWVEQPEL